MCSSAASVQIICYDNVKTNVVMVLFIKQSINRVKIKTQIHLTQELKALICIQFVSCEIAKNYYLF